MLVYVILQPRIHIYTHYATDIQSKTALGHAAMQLESLQNNTQCISPIEHPQRAFPAGRIKHKIALKIYYSTQLTRIGRNSFLHGYIAALILVLLQFIVVICLLFYQP
jgi:hypothetical protein